MTKFNLKRRLAAVLVADVVGYSRMMHEDQAETLARISDLVEDLLRPSFSGHSGIMVKSMGDGWLVRFDSATGAVSAAMQIQDKLADDPALKLRIGVHVSDVTESDDDIFGDGVNIAARLEGMAPPGGIAISDSVYTSLDGTLAPSFDAAGDKRLKNIDRPIRVWVRVAPAGKSAGPIALEQIGKERFPCLTIHPVACSDPKIEIMELAGSLTSDLGTYFGSILWLRSSVSSSNSSGGYVLSSSLRGQGDRLRFEVRVFGAHGTELWSGKFDGLRSESFEWQDRVGLEAASAITGLILDVETMRLANIDIREMTAEQCLLMGMMAWRSFASQSFSDALKFHASAIEKNPDLVPAYSEAIMVASAGKTMGLEEALAPYFEKLPAWLDAASRFKGLSPILDLNLAIGNYMRDRKADVLSATISNVLRRAPFDGQVLNYSGWGYLWSGKPDLALDCFIKAMPIGRNGPLYVAIMGGAATACVQLGRDEDALRYAEAGLALSETYGPLHSTRAAVYAMREDSEKAAEAIKRYLHVNPGKPSAGGAATWITADRRAESATSKHSAKRACPISPSWRPLNSSQWLWSRGAGSSVVGQLHALRTVLGHAGHWALSRRSGTAARASPRFCCAICRPDSEADSEYSQHRTGQNRDDVAEPVDRLSIGGSAAPGIAGAANGFSALRSGSTRAVTPASWD